jgi:hypothetical protein
MAKAADHMAKETYYMAKEAYHMEKEAYNAYTHRRAKRWRGTLK